MSETINKLKRNYIFAVIRGKDEADGYKIAEASITGGIKNIEITFSTPNAEKVISKIIKKFNNNESVVVGAGTVMSIEMAKEAYKAGAEFLVSPHFSLEISKFANQNNIYYIPGCATATEIVEAMEAGCEMIKVFPGGQLGPSFIKDIHGPIPEVQLMPSGGVSLDNIIDWKDSGAAAVGVGSAITKDVETNGYESVTEKANQLVSIIK